MKVQIFRAVLTLLFLSACSASNTNKDFLCDAQVGSPCTSIAAVDGIGTSNVTSVAERPEDTAVKSLSQDKLFAAKGSLNAVPDGGSPYNAKAYRSPEVVGTLWIAPILDEGGIFHEARFVHFLIQEGQWRQ